MTRHPIWLIVAILFTLINGGGAVYAAASGEPAHTGVHAVLLLVGVYFVRRLASQRRARPRGERPRDLTERLSRLEQSVDAVAIEVERIGEGQRFVTRLFTEQRAPQASAEGAAEPIAPPEGRRDR